MRKADALELYKTPLKLAEAAGVTRSAVYMWKDTVPELTAYKLQAVTGGALKVDPSLYPAKPRKTPESIVA